MERKGILCLFLFAVLILVSSSCHPRHVSDIKKDIALPACIVATVEGGHITRLDEYLDSAQTAVFASR